MDSPPKDILKSLSIVQRNYRQKNGGQCMDNKLQKIRQKLKETAAPSKEAPHKDSPGTEPPLPPAIEKIMAFLKKKLPPGRADGLMDIADLIANIMTLAVYCAIGPIIASYEGQGHLFYIASAAMLLMSFFLLYKILCCVGYENLNRFIKWCTAFPENTHAFIHDPSKRNPVLKAAGTAVFVFLFIYFCCGKTQYYASVTEVYGNPAGVGEPLSYRDQRGRSCCWEIKKYPFFRRRTDLTYIEPYGQTGLMNQYSTAYNMTLFQPSARIVYKYKKK